MIYIYFIILLMLACRHKTTQFHSTQPMLARFKAAGFESSHRVTAITAIRSDFDCKKTIPERLAVYDKRKLIDVQA